MLEIRWVDTTVSILDGLVDILGVLVFRNGDELRTRYLGQKFI